MKVILTKISDCENPLYPNHIKSGFIKEGLFIDEPRVGEPFYVGEWWRTSTVQEIISGTRFKTHNSIYEWAICSDNLIG